MAEKTQMTYSGLVRFLVFRFYLNWKSAFGYRISFWSQIFFMMANNAFMLWFWQLLFGHFGAVGTWKMQDMMVLWGIVPMGFGLGMVLAGNLMTLADAIADGDLDYFVALPPPTLVHVLMTKMRISAIGDILFGLAVLWIRYPNDWMHLGIACFMTLVSAIVFVSFGVIAASLAFFVGESRGLSFQILNFIIAFGTYPEQIFRGGLRFVFYSIIPAAFFAFLPARVIQIESWKNFESWKILFLSLGGAGGFMLLSVFIFYQGLKRYESGNMISFRI